MINALESSSTRPYLIRALYEWCTDNGFTPYVAVQVDDTVQVPREYVKNGEIVLNISFDATSSLKLGNDFIEFKARFAGSAREISVPVGRVIAIYARENGQGMAFPAPVPAASASDSGNGEVPSSAPSSPQGPARMPLRDASRGTEGDASKIVHLVTGDDADETVDAGPATDPADEPPRPPAGGGSRPSLKRIK
ncbi:MULTISPECIES: ClpXP protease specificity-enhancing factor [Variovorax]|jgi:stringent starvation protein B|uniref:ClpXP protease specificity-enhancing factor n=1 Tax=Variovorax TaxID=34072 RepID=UPI00086A1591|nr:MULTISPECIES: ClpXP protease specificity-enhancing factor [Variovorax]MBN8754544.1 ClpXP protease specificity-enhancing factor [Variovorax sp.]ODU17583.1 MAG: ClpXP protease specificity-enhancing factor [Variovorax sp. SCN 67-85]ODV24268.1 MAG: ClpXP protease specificity-enhancing factor [Variovorax sp. SCN 67-20]OJZ04144.1 MAG: ClpXP protease specificity-enhancing factor [Variovorax sp. 67-131]UKI09977.1 ClpXP protease specificity-enhancing factor [Variovorax paradoxus]